MSHQPTTAVVLIAHGSRREAANAELFALVERLKEGAHDRLIVGAFLELAEPDIETAAARCVDRGARLVLLVPYFLSMGMHLTRDLSNARDRLAAAHPGIEFRLGPPLGPDPALDRLVRTRIEQLDRISAAEIDRSGAKG